MKAVLKSLKVSDMKSDAQISYDLALAIGWTKADLVIAENKVFVWRGNNWREFSYTDPTVIWPIAVRFRKMPSEVWSSGSCPKKEWYVQMPDGPGTWCMYADSPEKAVALGVISEVTEWICPNQKSL